jgi:flagellar biosynthetic protein FliP
VADTEGCPPGIPEESQPRRVRGARSLLFVVTLLAGLFLWLGGSAHAATLPTTAAATGTTAAAPATAPGSGASMLTGTVRPSLLALPAAPGPTPSPAAGTVSVKVDPVGGKPSQTVSIILLLTVLSVAPALLVLTTSFTKIIVVLSLTRNALGTPTIPPNQVLAGLALFLSLFIMGPVLSQMNSQGVQPYLKGQLTQQQAFDHGVKPLRDFMMKQTRKSELATMVKLSHEKAPAKPADVPLTTLIPAFVLSELKSAFIIGFVVFIPFLVIDLVVSSSLMSMGMMMLPPVMISLPFKLLLFVMVDGWGLVAKSLVTSYH